MFTRLILALIGLPLKIGDAMTNRAYLIGGLKVTQSIVKNPVYVYKEDGGKIFDPSQAYTLGDRHNLIWDYDFSDGWNSRQRIGDKSDITGTAVEWMQSQMQTAGAGVVVDDPTGVDNRVMRHHWDKTKIVYNDNGTIPNVQKKSYLWCYKDHNDTQERWFGWRLYFPSDGFAADSHGTIVTQWHGHPDGGEPWRNPPLALNVKNGMLYCGRIYDERAMTPRDSTERGYEEGNRRTTVELGTLPLDEWIDFVVHVEWSPTASTGTLELWMNGEKLIDEVGTVQIGYNDDTGTNFGVGIYMWDQARSDYDTRTFYCDSVYIGTENATYEDVHPTGETLEGY